MHNSARNCVLFFFSSNWPYRSPLQLRSCRFSSISPTPQRWLGPAVPKVRAFLPLCRISSCLLPPPSWTSPTHSFLLTFSLFTFLSSPFFPPFVGFLFDLSVLSSLLLHLRTLHFYPYSVAIFWPQLPLPPPLPVTNRLQSPLSSASYPLQSTRLRAFR